MTTRDEARDVGPALAPAERSAVAGIRGLRWWVVVLVAALLALVGVATDLLRSGELGIVYTVCFPVGAVMASVWVRRGELFATCVQPPLLLAVCVPVAIVATGSLPRTGGLTATVLAVGGPMINGFPAMAVTTAVCLAVAFVRSRLQPLGPGTDDRDPAGRPDRDRTDRDRDRTDRDRTERVGDRPSRPTERRPDDRRASDRRETDRRDTDRRGDDRRESDRRPEERRDEAGRTGRPPSRPERTAPARRPQGEAEDPRAPGRESPGPGVYRVPRPPQASRPGSRPAPDAPPRPPRRPGPPPTDT